MQNILVTDAQLKASLAVIRSLGKKNLKITAGSEVKSGIGLHSKYCWKKVIYPNPRTNTKAFLEYLLDIVSKDDYECIIPTHTYTAYLLSKYRNVFSEYTVIPPPDFQVFVTAFDKKMLLKFALENDFACPTTYFSNDLEEIITTVNHYPVVVKPSKRHGVGIAICTSASDLREKYVEMSSKYGSCIVQEYIPNGGEFGIYTLFGLNSEPVALTVQKRVRSLHLYGGVSTLRETVKNEELVQIAFDLLKSIHWSGVAMVEFRIDTRDGIPKLMEINPRFWGSLQLSILSGVDFPYLLYKLIMQEDQPPMLNFKEGVQCRWLMGDITRFLWSPNKLKNLRSFLRPNLNHDVVSLKDPKPIVFSLLSPWDSCDNEPRDDSTVSEDVTKKTSMFITDEELT